MPVSPPLTPRVVQLPAKDKEEKDENLEPTFQKLQAPTDKVERYFTNYPRLYDGGVAIIENQLVQDKLEALLKTVPRESPFAFQVTSPQELLAGNLFVDKVIRESTFHEIRSKYPQYNFNVFESDFKGIMKQPTSIIQVLRQVKLIDNDNRINLEAFENDEVLGRLQSEFNDENIFLQVMEVLHCVRYRSSDRALLRCIISSKILDPRILVEMSNHQLTHEEASGLIALLSIKDSKKSIPVVDLKTGEYSNDVEQKIHSSSLPVLVLRSEASRYPNREVAEKEHSDKQNELMTPFRKYAERMVQVKEHILNLLSPFNSLASQEFLEDFETDFEDTIILSDFASLHDWFFDNNGWKSQWYNLIINQVDRQLTQVFELKCDDLKRYLIEISDEIKVVEGTISAQTLKFYNLHKSLEGQLTLLSANETRNLQEIFDRYKHIIYLFLILSTQKFKLDSTASYDVNWILDGVEVKERITREGGCVVARRLEFGSIESPKKDLVYFSEDGNAPSIMKRWEELKKRFRFSDSSLSMFCLELYINGKCDAPEEVKQFLVPLLVLLLGKEPSLDRASHLSNYIFLIMVRKNICSFEEALENMPMIPRGAVSSKQFLLHLIGRPIDSMTHVLSKKAKKVGSSFFLPNVGVVLGRADDWIEKYNLVTFVAKRCALEFLVNVKSFPTENPEIIHLKNILEMITGHEVPQHELCKVLENCGGSEKNNDPLGEWAINFVSKFHPLAKDYSYDVNNWIMAEMKAPPVRPLLKPLYV